MVVPPKYSNGFLKLWAYMYKKCSIELLLWNLKKIRKLGVSLFSIAALFASAPVISAEHSVETEIAAASEAAPAHITEEASYLVFEHGSIRTIRNGTNNFTCLVIRDPQGRFEPACLNEEAMRSVFPTYELEMKLLFAGIPPLEVRRHLSDAYDAGTIPTAESGALVYMMSTNNLNFNATTEILAPTPVHQMYYFPKMPDETFSLKGELPVRLWQGYPHLSALIVDIAE